MTDNKDETIEDVLDEDFNADESDVREALSLKHTIEAFNEPINLDTKSALSQGDMNELYKKIRNIPRKDLTKMLSALGGNGVFNSEHKFTGVSEMGRQEKIMSAREKLKNKLYEMKMKRASKGAKEAEAEKNKLKEEDTAKTMATIAKLLDEDEKEKKTTNESALLTKNQKKNRRKRNKKKQTQGDKGDKNNGPDDSDDSEEDAPEEGDIVLTQ